MNSYQRLKQKNQELKQRNKILEQQLRALVLNPKSLDASTISYTVIQKDHLDKMLLMGKEQLEPISLTNLEEKP